MTRPDDAAPLVVRPRRLVLVCRAVAVGVVAVFGLVASLLDGGSAGSAGTGQGGGARLGLADQVAFAGLGVLIAAVVLAFTRVRVVADAEQVRVRGVVGETVLPWQVVREVRLDEGAPWATLELHDDETVGLLAVQANDGDAAVDAVLALRRLLARSRGA